MRQLFLTASAVVVLALSTFPVMAQDDPCAGEVAANEIGFVYQGNCVLADKNGPVVQSVIVERHETLDGTSVTGVLLIQTKDGWKLSPLEFVTSKDVEFAEVGDSGHLLVDVTE
jgi:hypothetical protein